VGWDSLYSEKLLILEIYRSVETVEYKHCCRQVTLAQYSLRTFFPFIYFFLPLFVINEL
jgi:hypothetical protein